MKKLILTLLSTITIFGNYTFANNKKNFSLTSKDFKQGGNLKTTQTYNGFGCNGQNISPELSWKNPPKGTKSFALTMYDPDAPTGSGWWHWVVFNIPANINHLPAGAGDINKNLMEKTVIQSNTDFGTSGFGGACPPAGDKPHRYIFTLHALNVESLPLDSNSTPALVGFNLNYSTIDKATLTAKYGR